MPCLIIHSLPIIVNSVIMSAYSGRLPLHREIIGINNENTDFWNPLIINTFQGTDRMNIFSEFKIKFQALQKYFKNLPKTNLKFEISKDKLSLTF